MNLRERVREAIAYWLPNTERATDAVMQVIEPELESAKLLEDGLALCTEEIQRERDELKQQNKADSNHLKNLWACTAKCDKLAAERDELKEQLETARKWDDADHAEFSKVAAERDELKEAIRNLKEKVSD